MAIERIDSLDDPRVAYYRDLKDRELAKRGDRFIAEGEQVTRRLIESDYPVESVLTAERRAEAMAPVVPAGVPHYVAPNDLVDSIVGYQFHSGVIACGRRKPSPPLASLIKPEGSATTLLICPEVINADNMGSLIRIAAGFGVDGMLLGERSCDPFWRRSIRVSMGTVFKLPLVRSEDLLADLKTLKERWGVQLTATVLDETAEPLEKARRLARLGLLLGSESQGLHRRFVAACDRKVTIPMKLGTDSLNVAVAAGVFLYHFTREDVFA